MSEYQISKAAPGQPEEPGGESSGQHPDDITEADLDPSEIEVISQGRFVTVIRYARPLVRHFRISPIPKNDRPVE